MNAAHVTLAAILGFGFIVLIAILARRGFLSIRYALGWLLIGVLALLYPVLVAVSDEISDFLGVQPVAILLGAPLVIIGLVCVQLSISDSGLIRQVRDLSEAIAISNSVPAEDGDHPLGS